MYYCCRRLQEKDFFGNDVIKVTSGDEYYETTYLLRGVFMGMYKDSNTVNSWDLGIVDLKNGR